MHPRGPDDSRLGTAEHRPPSARSRDSLADGLRREVADARVRFEEAGLRAETHRLLGNDTAAIDATREQEDILADVEARLGRVVSAAVVQRDAEQVLADVTDLPADVTPPAPDPHEVRPRTPMLAGVASLLAVVAVSAAAVLGVTQGLDSVEIVGAASDREAQASATTTSPAPDEPADDEAPTSPAPLAGGSPDAATEASTPDGATTPEASDAVVPEAPIATPPNPPAGQAAVDESGAGDSELDQAVTDLLDAVGELDEAPDDPTPSPSESDSETPSVDADISGEDLEDVIEDTAPDAPDGPQDGGTDGFVPAPSAQ